MHNLIIKRYIYLIIMSCKDGIPQRQILTSSTYRSKISQQRGSTLNDQVYQSLLYYEKTLKIMQASLNLMRVHSNRTKMKNAFIYLNTYQRKELEEQEKNNLEIYQLSNCREIGEIIQEKIQIEELESQIMMEEIKEQFYEEQKIMFQGAFSIVNATNYGLRRTLFRSFNCIKNKNTQQIQPEKLSKKLNSVIHMIKQKNTKFVQLAFRKILQAATFNKSRVIEETIQEEGEQLIKANGRILTKLNSYPTRNLKRALSIWYLNSTEQGQTVFTKAAKNLVLYTNINKISAFYRLMSCLKQRKQIPPRVKKMATMLHLYTKLFFDRVKKDAFDLVKQNAMFKNLQIGFKIVKMARMRLRSALAIWNRKTKQKQNKNKQISVLNDRKSIIMKLLNKMVTCKINNIIEAMNKIRSLLNIGCNYYCQGLIRRANIFEKGLNDFVKSILRRSFNAFNANNNDEKYKNVLTSMININTSIKSTTNKAFRFLKYKTSNLQMIKKLNQLYTKKLSQAFSKLRGTTSSSSMLQLFKTSTHILTRNKIGHILPHLYYKNINIPTIPCKPYQLDQVQYIVKYFLRLMQQRKGTLKSVLNIFKEIPEKQFRMRINPWFKKSSQILCLNSRINIQKSFWRATQNSFSQGIAFNSSAIVKLKKLYKNLKKAYILTMYHAFLMIDHNIDSDQHISRLNRDEDYQSESFVTRSRKVGQYLMENSKKSRYNYSDIFQKINTRKVIGTPVSKIASLNKISIIFRRLLKQKFNSWHHSTQQNVQHSQCKSIFKFDNNSLNIARLDALSSLLKLSQKITILTKQKCFDRILCKTVIAKFIIQYQQNANKINHSFKKHEYLSTGVQSQFSQPTQQKLDHTPTQLRHKNNYLIIQKFCILIEYVYYRILQKNLDHTFDAIMEEANKNFELTTPSNLYQ